MRVEMCRRDGELKVTFSCRCSAHCLAKSAILEARDPDDCMQRPSL